MYIILFSINFVFSRGGIFRPLFFEYKLLIPYTHPFVWTRFQWRSQVIGIGRAPAVRLTIVLTTPGQARPSLRHCPLHQPIIGIIVINLVLCMHQYCWVACRFGIAQHIANWKHWSAYPTDAIFRDCFTVGVVLESRSRNLLWSKNNVIMVMATCSHELQRKSLMRN